MTILRLGLRAALAVVAASTSARAAPGWSRLSVPATPAREAQGFVFIDDGRPPFAAGFGGCRQGTCFGDDVADLTASIDLFADGWRHLSLDAGPYSRFGALFAAAGDGTALLFGGSGSRVYGDTWRFDGETWTQLAPPESPPARAFAAGAADPEHRLVVLFGGENDAGQVLGDLWLYSEGRWLAAGVDGDRPAPRTGSAMASLGGGRFLLFGGGAPEASADTWVLTCRTDVVGSCAWQARRAGARDPGPRWGHALAFDPPRGVAMLFGGAAPAAGGGTNILGDVWEWRESGWTERTDEPAPPPRFRPALAWDAARRRFVLWGGEAGLHEPPTDDLWAFGEPEAAPPDAGTPAPDAGTPAPDAGTSAPDAGAPEDSAHGRYGCHAAVPAGLGLVALLLPRRRRSR